MIHKTIVIIEYLLLAYLTIQILYLLFFSTAGKIGKKNNFPGATHLRKIRVFIPGYKEDSVIIDTAKDAIRQNYPRDLFEIVIIADSFSETTLNELKTLPIKVVEVSFEKSTKGKALQKAIEATAGEPVDIVLILDADNHMSQGFLNAVNDAFEQGFDVVQGHRTAKNSETHFALLDACTEEINNHIFRRGHVAVNLPSALIGSGMAFKWDLFTSLLQDIGDTSGEDKELEFRIVRLRKSIAFLDGKYVFDEKVAKQDVFSKQRSRWLATQVEFFEKYFIEGWIQLFKGNVAFFNKVFQTYLLPRVMLVAVFGVWFVFTLIFAREFLFFSSCLLAALMLSLLMGIPSKWYNKQLLFAFLQIPGALFAMLKAMLNIGKARKQFIHTPHGEIKP
ncbi:Glycosyltransferase, catalytic subunit of cellulose synthase and poly-beta-1,6-N-acetylglucosamine synthase [Pseudarcicella hirudinis]|uniref:Glycosyltransferase, catalytic subunit of cellulose synthase and poly-beta-1,6-N-acetylglucosamine synthase n=1 Tax=Pseudarcicella hirudinis TaxID=1079859 RepID=A0A1I5XAJ5_9BACT|nr:glycosyltransferase family 2 protein [Pseudarcicella hirudinis]SFQ28980.1 Glycosyltransferase, catalytic subunit of cellulose synthase and poly-beta-1,6-N-acetylglucosamine synthase [Pseudarcicella hirudinis]